MSLPIDVDRLADALHAVQGGAFLASRSDAEKVLGYYNQMAAETEAPCPEQRHFHDCDGSIVGGFRR